jgi:hypothetical protein
MCLSARVPMRAGTWLTRGCGSVQYYETFCVISVLQIGASTIKMLI